MRYFALLTLLFTSRCIVAQHSDLTERMDAYMRQMNEQGLSASVMCIRDGKEILNNGYGFSNEENKIPNTTKTIFTVGSITKQFTAAAILKLEMQGLLTTSELMSKYISGVPADKQEITLHQLLTMNAGFTEALGDDYDPITRDEFIRMALSSKLESAPGKEFLYSNVNYSLLGAIVEIVSGKDYETYCRENLWLPAGMKCTGYVQPEWNKMELSVGYNKHHENTGTSLSKKWDKNGPYWNLKCNGGVLSNCEDMYKWYLALKTEIVLSDKMKSKMYQPYIAEGPQEQSHYGYGWAVVKTQRNTTLITHNGGNGIFFADYLNYQDENAFVFVQSNSSKRGQQDVAWELGRMMMIPGYEPEVKDFSPVLLSLNEAENKIGAPTLSNFVNFLQGSYSGGIEEFLKSNLGPGFLESMPMQEHVDVFTSLKKRFDGTQFKEMFYSGEMYELHFILPDKSVQAITVELNDMGKIRGLIVD